MENFTIIGAIFIFVSLLDISRSQNCPTDYTKQFTIDGSGRERCVRQFAVTNMTWYEAKSNCTRDGADLVTLLGDPFEKTFLEDHDAWVNSRYSNNYVSDLAVGYGLMQFSGASTTGCPIYSKPTSNDLPESDLLDCLAKLDKIACEIDPITLKAPEYGYRLGYMPYYVMENMYDDSDVNHCFSTAENITGCDIIVDYFNATYDLLGAYTTTMDNPYIVVHGLNELVLHTIVIQNMWWQNATSDEIFLGGVSSFNLSYTTANSDETAILGADGNPYMFTFNETSNLVTYHKLKEAIYYPINLTVTLNPVDERIGQAIDRIGVSLGVLVTMPSISFSYPAPLDAIYGSSVSYRGENVHVPIACNLTHNRFKEKNAIAVTGPEHCHLFVKMPKDSKTKSRTITMYGKQTGGSDVYINVPVNESKLYYQLKSNKLAVTILDEDDQIDKIDVSSWSWIMMTYDANISQLTLRIRDSTGSQASTTVIVPTPLVFDEYLKLPMNMLYSEIQIFDGAYDEPTPDFYKPLMDEQCTDYSPKCSPISDHGLGHQIVSSHTCEVRYTCFNNTKFIDGLTTFVRKCQIEDGVWQWSTASKCVEICDFIDMNSQGLTAVTTSDSFSTIYNNYIPKGFSFRIFCTGGKNQTEFGTVYVANCNDGGAVNADISSDICDKINNLKVPRFLLEATNIWVNGINPFVDSLFPSFNDPPCVEEGAYKFTSPQQCTGSSLAIRPMSGFTTFQTMGLFMYIKYTGNITLTQENVTEIGLLKWEGIPNGLQINLLLNKADGNGSFEIRSGYTTLYKTVAVVQENVWGALRVKFGSDTVTIDFDGKRLIKSRGVLNLLDITQQYVKIVKGVVSPISLYLHCLEIFDYDVTDKATKQAAKELGCIPADVGLCDTADLSYLEGFAYELNRQLHPRYRVVSSVTYSCSTGLRSMQASSVTYQCLENGTWSSAIGEDIVCKEYKCVKGPGFDSMYEQVDSMVKQEANKTITTDTTGVSAATTTAASDAATAIASAADGTTSSVPLVTSGISTNSAQSTGFSQDAINFGESLYFKCKEPYFYQEDPGGSFKATCEEDGALSMSTECTVPECPSLDNYYEGSDIIGNDGLLFTLGDTASFKCWNDWIRVYGSLNRTCVYDEREEKIMWTGEPLICVLYDQVKAACYTPEGSTNLTTYTGLAERSVAGLTCLDWEKIDEVVLNSALSPIKPTFTTEDLNQCYLLDNDGVSYTGNVNVSINGASCVKWKDPGLEIHHFQFDIAPESANCRNYNDQNYGQPWCYIRANPPIIEVCEVPVCVKLNTQGNRQQNPDQCSVHVGSTDQKPYCVVNDTGQQVLQPCDVPTCDMIYDGYCEKNLNLNYLNATPKYGHTVQNHPKNLVLNGHSFATLDCTEPHRMGEGYFRCDNSTWKTSRNVKPACIEMFCSNKILNVSNTKYISTDASTYYLWDTVAVIKCENGYHLNTSCADVSDGVVSLSDPPCIGTKLLCSREQRDWIPSLPLEGCVASNCSHLVPPGQTPQTDVGCVYGYCKNEKECVCDYGTGGVVCDQFVCSTNCTDRGNCTGPEMCTCDFGYMEDDCSKVDRCLKPIIYPHLELYDLKYNQTFNDPILNGTHSWAFYNCSENYTTHVDGIGISECYNQTWSTDNLMACMDLCTCEFPHLNGSTTLWNATMYVHPSGVGDYFQNSTIDITCQYGHAAHTPLIETHQTLTCNETCMWSNWSPCRKMSCDDPALVNNGIIEYHIADNSPDSLLNLARVGSMYNVVCDEGYALENGTLKHECNLDFSNETATPIWETSGPDPACYKYFCDMPTNKVKNGSLDFTGIFNTSFGEASVGSKYFLTCDEGYKMPENVSVECIGETIDGIPTARWNNHINSTCEKYHCDVPPKYVAHGQRNFDNITYLTSTTKFAHVGSTYYLQCNYSFKEAESVTIQCVGSSALGLISAAWKGNESYCVQNFCDHVHVHNGRPIITIPTNHWLYAIGTTYFAKCNAFYVLRQNVTVECLPANDSFTRPEWSSDRPVCERSYCGAISDSVPNGVLRINGSEVSSNITQHDHLSRVELHCEEGYDHLKENNTYAECVLNPSTNYLDWQFNPMMSCFKRFCESLPPVQDSDETITRSESSSLLMVGTTIEYKCTLGYDPAKATLLICVGDEHVDWDITQPICTMVTCGISQLLLTDNTEIEGYDSINDAPDIFEYNTAVTVRCKDGLFRYYGDSVRTCREDGYFDGIHLTCYKEIVSCPSLDLPEPTVDKLDAIWTHNGYRIEFNCHDKNDIVGDHEMWCLPNGTWIGYVPYCRADGAWSEWSNWDLTCTILKTAHTYRARTCTNPAPLNGGEPCEGVNIEHASDCAGNVSCNT